MAEMLALLNGNPGVLQLGLIVVVAMLWKDVRHLRSWLSGVERRLDTLQGEKS